MIQAILFDCDGVLFDSHGANIEYFNAVLRAAGEPPLDREGERLATMLAGSQLLQALCGDDDARIERLRTAATALDYTPFFAWMNPVPDLHRVLAELKPHYRLGMATNRGSTVPQVVEHFGLDPYFEIAVGVLDVARPKPYPDMLERCLDHFQLAGHQALYVGDSPSDFTAAQAAGMHFLGIGGRTGAPRWVERLDQVATALTGVA